MYKVVHAEVIIGAHTEVHLLNGISIFAKQKPYSIYRNKAFALFRL